MSDLVLVSVAAEAMGVSYHSAKRSLKNAGIKFERVGHAPAVRQADFAAFLARRSTYKGRGRLPSALVQAKTTEGSPDASGWASLSEKIQQVANEADVSPYRLMKVVLDYDLLLQLVQDSSGSITATDLDDDSVDLVVWKP